MLPVPLALRQWYIKKLSGKTNAPPSSAVIDSDSEEEEDEAGEGEGE